MKFLILSILCCHSALCVEAPKGWNLFDQAKKDRQKMGDGENQITIDYDGAWKSPKKELGVYSTFFRPNPCKSQEDVVGYLSVAVRQQLIQGSKVLKVESILDGLGMAIHLKTNGKAADILYMVPSVGGWTNLGLNRLVKEPQEKFDITMWNVKTLSDNKQKKDYREVIKWFVDSSEEFIQAETKKLDK